MTSPCPRCATPAPEGERFCRACGSTLSSPAPATSLTCHHHPGQPATGVCPRCGAFACATCLTADTGAEVRCGACRARAPEAVLPWDARRELGTLRAFWRTCLLLERSPDVTLSSARREAPFADSYLFAGLAHLLAFAPTLGVQMAIMFASMLGLKGAAAPHAPSGVVMALSMLVGYGMLLAGWVLAVPLVSAGVDHLALRLLGASPRPFAVTMRAWALSRGPMLTGLLPCCGVWAFLPWTFALKVMAYRRLHGSPGGRTLAAAMVVPGLGLLALTAYFAFIVALVSSIAKVD